MSSFVSTNDAFTRVWNSSAWADTNLVKRLLLEKLDQFKEKESTFFSKVKELPEIANLKPLWMEEKDYPASIVCTLSGTSPRYLTVTGTIMNATATLALLKKIVKVGAIVRYEAGGTTAIARVSALDGSNPIMTVVADANTSLPTNDTGMTWTIVSEPSTDAEAADDPRILDRKTRFTTTQIFSEVFELTKTRSNLGMEVIGNETEHQIDNLLRKMRRDQSRAAVQMWPYMNSTTIYSAMEEERSRLMGLEFWVNYLFGSGMEFENASILKDLSGAAPDITDIDDLALTMYLNGSDFGSGDWQIWCNPRVRKYLHDFQISYRQKTEDSKRAGFAVDSILLKIGKEVNVYDDLYIPERQLYLLDMSQLGYGYFKDDKISREEISMDTSRVRRWHISCQMYGLVVRKAPVSLGLLKNLSA